MSENDNNNLNINKHEIKKQKLAEKKLFNAELKANSDRRVAIKTEIANLKNEEKKAKTELVKTRKKALSSVDNKTAEMIKTKYRENLLLIEEKYESEIENVKREYRHIGSLLSNKLNRSGEYFSQTMQKSRDRLHANKSYKIMNKYSKIITTHFNRYSIFYILAIVVLIFTGLTTGKMLRPAVFIGIFSSNFYIFIISMGMLLVIVSGNIDLSVGRLMGFLAIASIYIYNSSNSVTWTIIAILLIGLAVGIIDGILIGYFKIPAFIVTLGSMLIFQGAAIAISGGSGPTLNGNVNSAFSKVFNTSISSLNVGTDEAPFFIIAFLIFLFVAITLCAFFVMGRKQKFKYGLKTESLCIFVTKQVIVFVLLLVVGYFVSAQILGLQLYIIYILITITIFIFITQNTKFGRSVYAIGGNKKAAALSGISIERTTFKIFVIIAILSAYAGLMFAGLKGSVSSSTGSALELNVISAVFVGGASVSGGVGTIINTVVGTLIIAVIQQGSFLIELTAEIQQIVTGLILVAAVGYDVFARRKSK